jgi:outer membrane lipoprotein-sorting protein
VSGQNLIGTILKRMSDHNKALQSLSADVTMVKYDAVLKVMDTTLGKVTYLPAAKDHKRMMRLEWRTPDGKDVEDTLIVEGDKFKLYKHRINELVTGTVKKNDKKSNPDTIFSFMNMNKIQVQENYKLDFVDYETVKSGEKTGHLQLTPKIISSYKSADLWVDVNGMPLQTRIVEKNNDWTTVLLTNIRKNETVNPSIFELKTKKKPRIVPM